MPDVNDLMNYVVAADNIVNALWQKTPEDISERTDLAIRRQLAMNDYEDARAVLLGEPADGVRPWCPDDTGGQC